MLGALADVCRRMHRDGWATVAARGGAYTLGLTRALHPELAIDGFREEVCTHLAELVARHVAMGVKYRPGAYELAGMPIEVAEVPAHDYIPARLAALAGGSVRVLRFSPGGPTRGDLAVAVSAL